MKLDVSSPSLLQGRDALIAAANAGPGGVSDANDVRIAFAVRGAGAGATSTNPTSGEISVTESFSPDVILDLNAITFSDALGNGNGFAVTPARISSFSIPLRNPGAAAVAVTATIGSFTANFGSIGASATVTKTMNYRVPAGTPCGSLIVVPIVVTGPIGTGTFTYLLRVGTPDHDRAPEFRWRYAARTPRRLVHQHRFGVRWRNRHSVDNDKRQSHRRRQHRILA